jgi:hypothetical protein
MNLKKVFCVNCKKAIYRSKGRINENLKFGYKFYCSRKCLSFKKTKQKWFICENCGKSFRREPSQTSPHNYCSKSCAAKINNKKYQKRKTEFKICIKCGKKFKRSIGNLKYCSVKCRRETEQKSVQEILEIIKLKARGLKRTPAKRELEKINDACIKIFGSWNNAIAAAGLHPHRSHSQRMYKRINTKALDGHLCDSVSEAIVDNWLTKNKIPHKRNVFYPNTNYKADWEIKCGKNNTMVEYFGLAKDSPRYDRTIREKKALCRKYEISLIAIYPWDLYPKNRLNKKLRNILKK